MTNPTRATLLRYAALGVPLAFVGLPIYVHIPKFYGDLQAMNLVLLGALLLGIRLLDCAIDPMIGWLRDRYPHAQRWMMRGAIPFLVLGYALVFHPPADASSTGLALWLGASLSLVYLCYSILMVNYYASAVALASSEQQATRVSSYREAAMLVGVLLASLLPPLLSARVGADSYHYLTLLFAAMLVGAAWITLRLPLFRELPTPAEMPVRLGSFVHALRQPAVRNVLLVLLFNSVPTAITGTLFFFFCQDVLKASETQAGIFLVVYFVSAAALIPFWSWLSRRMGSRNALAVGMVLAIVTFMFAATLGAGDISLFFIICIASGAASGADAALLPAMFAQAVKTTATPAGIGFGLWHLLGKLTLALAAGMVLPLLAMGGYAPGGGASINVLSLAYALIPCLLKIIAIGLLIMLIPNRKEIV